MNLENSFQKRYSIITNLKLEQFLWIKSKNLNVEVNPYFASVLIIYLYTALQHHKAMGQFFIVNRDENIRLSVWIQWKGFLNYVNEMIEWDEGEKQESRWFKCHYDTLEIIYI